MSHDSRTGSPFESRSDYDQDILRYVDGQLAIKISGEEGTVFDWEHKWAPTQEGEAIVITESGTTYFIHNGYRETIIVDVRETKKQGRIVAMTTEEYPSALPAVEFHKPWQIPELGSTPPIQKVLLKYKNAFGDAGEVSDIDARGYDPRQTDDPNPFAEHRAFLERHGYRKHLPDFSDF
jgi:hypothetical protein